MTAIRHEARGAAREPDGGTHPVPRDDFAVITSIQNHMALNQRHGFELKLRMGMRWLTHRAKSLRIQKERAFL